MSSNTATGSEGWHENEGSEQSSNMLYKLPPGAWDSHVHVVDEEHFPFHPSHPYRPKRANLNDLLSFESTLGISHVVLVCVSPYGPDNTSILDALTRLRARGGARAVVCIDPPTTTHSELLHMHSLGVRGVRVNLKTRNEALPQSELVALLWQFANKIRALGWVLQLYAPLPQLALIASEIPHLGVSVCIDHLAHPSCSAPPSAQPGYASLLQLLRHKHVYIKLSGTYRFSSLPSLSAYAQEILRIAPTQVVWASDWPHTGSVENNPGGDRTKHQEYRQVDDLGFVNQCMEWCGGDEELVRRIWVDNPKRLWQWEEGIESRL